ncbi:hypothetical protein [Lacticaseibacillus paracasei]|uniref:hypothetical protein n=1 Tax=Lacticaseibacillus paracasei TaxID=1597 RepID=UPI00097805FE|nr:hypothetical protein [Lacticaseibacillus paracasei]MCT2892758.1 hypothetical protein [Lacticaseibacillus paracasei]MCT3363800.1 hypothetical protein [Lacticaseibacillus paracasei]MDK6821163.1 hypothetical protein [Lacticaseibacillus paracasei]MDK7798025.1 hypothetical protein [Lacticaseibacillus paracasei]UYX00746.1 hypothetical protein OH134_00275 [Lacticaseibacillus paracasei subsp. tolerans]
MRSNKSSKLLSLTILSIFAIFLLSVVWTLCSDTKITRNVPLILVPILTILSFIHYAPAPKTKQQPLFVPKRLGIGISVNPNNPTGRLFWYLVFAVMTILIIVVAFSN